MERLADMLDADKDGMLRLDLLQTVGFELFSLSFEAYCWHFFPAAYIFSSWLSY